MDIVNISDETYGQEVLQSDLPVLVDVWAPWCGPCKSMTPVVERVVELNQEKVKLVMANIEDLPLRISEWSVRATPTLLIFNQGEEVARHAGPMTETQISEWLTQHI